MRAEDPGLISANREGNSNVLRSQNPDSNILGSQKDKIRISGSASPFDPRFCIKKGGPNTDQKQEHELPGPVQSAGCHVLAVGRMNRIYD
jgi:hypothetical protein